MLKTIMLGLVLAAVALSGAVSVASAETVPSPLQQVRDGVLTGEVMCSENRVLMVSQIGMPACVFEESVLKLETRGFEFVGEPFDMFPIKSSDMADSTLWTGDPPPEISISRLPNIGETAVVEINFTNAVWGDVTDTERYRNGFFETGWQVSSEFEIVDSGGLKYETRYRYGTNEITAYYYTAFTPLNAGESKTYRIEVRAVEEGKSAVSAYGYGEEVAIVMYLDDEETMLTHVHMAKYPEMYEISTRVISDKDQPPKPLTDEESRALEQNVREPTREELIEFITMYVRDEQLSIEWALDNLLLPSGPLNMTDVRQILSDAGYVDGEIDDALSQYPFTQSPTKDTSVDSPEFAVTGADEPVIITINSNPSPIGTNITGKVGELYGYGQAPYCPLPSAISVQVPNSAKMGEPFDVVITSSYELTRDELDKFNSHHRTDFDDAEDIWEEYCYYKSFYLGLPYNYEPFGENVTLNVNSSIDSGYYPPYKTYGHRIDLASNLDTPSITFQMTVSEPVIYTRADLYDRNNTDYYKYDFGRLHIESTDNLFDRHSVSIYTSISGKDVILSEYEPVRSRSDTGETPNLNEQFVPFKIVDRDGITVLHIDNTTASEARSDAPENATSSDVPFEWIAESLETGPYAGSDPEEFIKRFGLDDDYVRRFLEAYPQYRTTTSTG